MPKMPQMDLIAELKKRQVKPQVREGKDGVLEDIITGRNRSWRRVWNGRSLCIVKKKKNSHSLFCWPSFRFEEHAVQEDRWSTGSTAPGHLSGSARENPPRAKKQASRKLCLPLPEDTNIMWYVHFMCMFLKQYCSSYPFVNTFLKFLYFAVQSGTVQNEWSFLLNEEKCFTLTVLIVAERLNLTVWNKSVL